MEMLLVSRRCGACGWRAVLSVWCNSSETRTGAAATCLGPRGTGQLSRRVPVDFTNSERWSGRGYAPRYDTLRHGRHVCDVLRCSVSTNNSYILAAGLYYYLASTLQYLNHIYQKKIGRMLHHVHSVQSYNIPPQ